jgi:putative restriction endonuclease
METKTPLIYFERPLPNVYVPLVGAYIVDANFRELNVTVAIDSTMRAQYEMGIGEIEKRYVTSEVKRRVHQPLFRAQVINAYERRCAICRLNHAVLLDAAHIIPDADIGGTASIPNGLALCKIHHAAYDKNFLGIDADYRVHIDEDLLIEIDGPMLQHGLKEMHHTRISVPAPAAQKPNKEKLAQRFELFVAS